MGMFSWNCKACGHPLLSHGTTEEHNEWMTQGIILTSAGELCRDEYDGYGRCGSWDYNESGSGDPEVYHEACWEVLGKPNEFTGPSEDARDQGFNFDDNVHNVHAPKTMDDLHNIKIAGDLAQQVSCDSWRICHLEYLISQVHDVVMSGRAVNGKELTDIRKQIERHIEQRTKKENEDEAKRLGLSYDHLMELAEHMRALLLEDASKYKKERPTQDLQKAEKLENGMFRLTLHSDAIVDMDYPNDKAYMVEDPYEEIAPGTERDDWNLGGSSRMKTH